MSFVFCVFALLFMLILPKSLLIKSIELWEWNKHGDGMVRKIR